MNTAKRGKKWANFKPSQLPNESTVKDAKRKDVLNLLSEIGVSAFDDNALSHRQTMLTLTVMKSSCPLCQPFESDHSLIS